MQGIRLANPDVAVQPEKRLYRHQRIALVVPCYNEEEAINRVVHEFKAEMPALDIYVFDNASSDRTVEKALAAGATVVKVPLRRKGNVVRCMFADVEADVYVMVDGDATYHAASVHSLVDKLLDEGLDVVVGCRETAKVDADAAYRRGHQLGNRLLTGGVVQIFGGGLTDMLSGYRAFFRRYAKSFPAVSHGFETETELTVHALALRMPYGEIVTLYSARLEGSESKLSTYKDGWRILKTIGRLYLSEKPLSFFGGFAVFLALSSLGLAIPIIAEFIVSSTVPRLPTAVLSAAMMISAGLSLSAGLVLSNVNRGRHEVRRFAYLAIPATRE